MLNNYGFVRVSAVVPELKVADTEYNVNEIIKQINIVYNSGTQIVSFPELCITGYTCQDLFLQDVLINSAYDGLEKILQVTSDLNIVIIVGMPLRCDNQLFNVAVVINKSKILGIVPKTYIPNYSEFYEKRWFASSLNKISDEIEILNQTVPFGTGLVFKCLDDKKLAFGIEICEDLWSLFPNSNNLTLNGASLIFNLSASNELIGKYEYRKNLVKNQSSKCICGYVFASCGVNESSSDVVFSGHSMICENGEMLAEGERFKFESTVITQDIDYERVMNLRYRDISYMGVIRENKSIRSVNFTIQNKSLDFIRNIKPNPFVPTNELEREARCQEILNIQASGLAKRLKHLNLSKTVIGISGGLDSSLAFLVIVEAYKKLGIDNKNILAITMPGFGTCKRTYQNSVKLIESFNASFREINIKDACLQHYKDINHAKDVFDISYENAQARERMQILMDIANMEQAIVIGTSDVSELVLGWTTFNGDHMSNYSVNSSIPKTLVKYLIQWVADRQVEQIKKVLYDILDTPISPELLPVDDMGNIKQKTEDTVGPYALNDFFLYHFLRFGTSLSKVLYLAEQAFKGKYTRKEIIKWLRLFIKRFFNNQFKRNCVPDGVKVGTISVSPRGDLRMPSDASFNIWLKELEDLE